MKKITVKAFAKINLALDVLEKLPNGYHAVQTVMQQIDLSDRVTVAWDTEIPETEAGKIALTTDSPELPPDGGNLAWRAARLMLAEFAPAKPGKVSIHIEKRIPVAAGLAGGSGDAAAVMHALAFLWGLRLPLESLVEKGALLGADVPFCVMGQAALNPETGCLDTAAASAAALAEGVGELLTPLPALEGWILLVKPPVSVSTAEIYGKIAFEKIGERPDVLELAEGLRRKDMGRIKKNMVNVLEKVSAEEYPVIKSVKDKLLAAPAREAVLMSGSGPAVFAFFKDEKPARKAYTSLRKVFGEIFLVKLIGTVQR
ncbi:MAG: 4-(cytidine 5'-diphospho)-2-C-methyl-D-erythritol kinase [Clostridiales Family XIII bacterium]|jgi:4-diphosphocytidyl-2-C-methyl-D-erythritol kinase|nr:4-(cytidine 5'-diphospho)-2-C-methyl-D-erythritol kinase [Clostridiales Family XIII bacterium]